MGERIPTIYHVEGSDNMEEKKAIAERKHKVRTILKADALVPGETIERKEKHIRMYESALVAVEGLMNKFGYEPKPIDISQVHFVENHPAKEMERNLGYFRSADNSVVVLEQDDDFHTFQTLIHELMHYQSFNTLTYNTESTEFHKARIGFSHSVYDKENNTWETRLNILNEAMTETFSIDAMDDSFKEKKDAYSNELIENLLESDPVLAMARSITESISPKITTTSGYTKEIGLLRRIRILIDDKDNTFIKDLADGYFGGNTLKVARRLDASFGKGFFNKLTQDLNPSEYIVDIMKRIKQLEETYQINSKE